MATDWANALADVMERRRLYQVIGTKKYPQVEAWLTVGRMDNVVARESGSPRRLEDGGYEAEVDLVRLSDMAIVGHASAICGMDEPRWAKAAEYARRSMAVTRATSRAFRLQYSWVMALAGYEPTPAEEMLDIKEQKRLPAPAAATGEPELVDEDVVYEGTMALGNSVADGNLRSTTDGAALIGFRLDIDGDGYIPQVIAERQLAVDIADSAGGDLSGLVGQHITVAGDLYRVPWTKGKPAKAMPPFQRLILRRIKTSEWTLPASVIAEGQEPMDLP